MRRISLAIAVVAAMVVSYGLGRRHSEPQAGANTGRRILYYVDPMHPAYKSDKPGIAPDCGMQLEPVYAGEAGSASPAAAPAPLPAGSVSIDGATRRLLGIQVVPVERSGATRVLKVVGRVAPEDTRVYNVNSGVDGFIRRTFNDSVGTLVKKNQTLATYYAPDILPAASGFLAATERVPGSQVRDGNRTTPYRTGAVSLQGFYSLEGYTDHLRNLGMSDLQINQVAESRQLPTTINIIAPADGFILARNISPGQHFTRDTGFYRIADLSRVWVVAELYDQEAPYVRPGAPARIVVRAAGRQLPARVTDSLPESQDGGGIVKVRLEADNPGFLLRPEMLVDVELPVQVPAAVTVPLDAVIDSGPRARVYVERSDGVFQPREVETGWRFGDRAEILHGLAPGERVVAAATFLVDSESRLSALAAGPAFAKPAGVPVLAAAAKMVKDPNCGMAVDPAKAAAAGNTLTHGGTTYYFCSRQCKLAFQKHPGSAGKRQADDD